MKFIGNIVTDGKFEATGIYNVVKDINDIVDGVPTLIVGWKKAKSIFPDVDILEWEIKDDFYWTFGKRERNWRYEDDVERFKSLCVNSIKDRIGYHFFNILAEGRSAKESLISNIKNPYRRKWVYMRNGMLYLYFEGKNTICGISLRDIDYERGNHNTLLSMINDRANSVNVVKMTDESYGFKMISINNPYLIPYMFSDY